MEIRRLLLVAGGLLVVAGIFWPWLRQVGLGRLPGDIVIERSNFQFYFPLVTSLLLSAGLTLLFWLLRK
jgi:hypothetical protein